MSREEIEKLAEYHGIDSLYRSGVVDFANEIYQLGRKHGSGFEREECAKICDEQANGAYWEGADVCAWAIRERGKE